MKLTETQQEHRLRSETALKLRRDGATYQAIGEHFGVSRSMAQYMVRRAERREREPPLSRRAQNILRDALTAAGYDKQSVTPLTISKLTCFEVVRTPNCGKGTLREIEDWLSAHGLALTKRYGPVIFSQSG